MQACWRRIGRGALTAGLLALLCACSGGLSGRSGHDLPPWSRIVAEWPGASAEEIERLVVVPLEGGLLSLPQLTRVTSTSRVGRAELVLEFGDGLHPEEAMQGIVDVLQRIQPHLPPTARPPWAERDGRNRSATVVLSGGGPQQLSEQAAVLARDVGYDPYVVRTDLVGASEPHIEVLLDPARLVAFGVAPARVLEAIEGAPLPRWRSPPNTSPPGSTTDDPEELGDLVLPTGQVGEPVRLKDLATLSVVAGERVAIVRLNSEPAVAFDVFTRASTEQADLLQRVREKAGPPGGRVLDCSTMARITVSTGGTAQDTARVIEVGAAAARAVEPGLTTLGIAGAVDASAGELRLMAPRESTVQAALSALRGTPGVSAWRADDPTGRIVEIQGRDREALRRVSAELRGRLGALPDLRWVGLTDPDVGRPELRVELDRAALARLGVDHDEAQSAVRLVTGEEVPRPWPREVTVRMQGSGSHGDPTATLVLTGPEGGLLTVPLRSVARIEQLRAATVLLRVDGVPTTRLALETADGASPRRVEKGILEVLGAATLEPGLSVQLVPRP